MNAEAQKAAALEAELAEMDKVDAVPVVPAPEAPPAATEANPATVAPVEPPKEPEKPVQRQTFTMPVAKHTEQMNDLKAKHATELETARAEAKAEAIAEAAKAAAPDGNMTDAKIKSFAEKYDTDPESVKDLLALAREGLESNAPKPAESPKPQTAPVDLDAARKDVDLEFYRDVYPELLRQNATQEHIDKARNRIQELAFTDEYHTTKVKDIFAQKNTELGFAARASAESSRGGSSAGMIDYSRLTDQDVKAMSPAEAEKYFAWEDAQTKSSRYKT